MKKIINAIKYVSKKTDIIKILKMEEIPFSVESVEVGIYTDIVVVTCECETANSIYYFLAELALFVSNIETKVTTYKDDDNYYAEVVINYLERGE